MSRQIGLMANQTEDGWTKVSKQIFSVILYSEPTENQYLHKYNEINNKYIYVEIINFMNKFH